MCHKPSTATSQKTMLTKWEKRTATQYKLLIELMGCEKNPLTPDDIDKLIALSPKEYEKFSFLGAKAKRKGNSTT